ncbi:MAG: hypothetical protein LAO78_01230 [Acidobacteriia bacterium]|nr:hypothetical protein [Terriglobia bacterium]
MFQRTRHPAWMFLCVASLLLFSTLPALAQVSQSVSTDAGAPQQGAPAGNSAQVLPVVPVVHAGPAFHGVPFRDPNDPNSAAVGLAAPAGAHLTYFGGPIISNVQVVQVLYGSGSYNAQVAGTTTPSMGNFFSDITSTGLITLLQQYNTPVSGGTGQTFGNGTFGGLFQIVPAAGNNGSTITDAQIQSELLAQITAGHLPAPLIDATGHPNTLYMIYFPPGKTITQGGSSSCVAGGFCAYHGTTSTLFSGKNVLYGVMPDMQAGSGCASGCGASTTFGNYTSVTSHELVEAMTDAFVGIATTFAPPLAWYDMTNGEIGDICNGQQGTYVANGTSYVIQLEFSNSASNCVNFPVQTGPDFSVTASPASQTVTAGAGTSYTATATASGGFTGTVSFSVSGLPAGASASFSPASVAGSGSSTLSVTTSITTPAGTYTLTITGTSGALVHSSTVKLVVNPVGGTPDFTISVSPASLNVTRGTTGNYTVTIGAVNGFSGTVSLSVAGLGSRVTATFSPTTVTGSGTSTLSVVVNRRATRNTRTLTITGVSGSLSHSTTATLVIQ